MPKLLLEDKIVLVVKVDGGADYAIRFTKERMDDKEKCVTITDVTCCDCSGVVTLFAIPDKVWSGLGLTTEWICLACVARRLNPHCTAGELDVTPDEFACVINNFINSEIRRHKREFKLKNINKYCGTKRNSTGVVRFANLNGATTATADQVMKGWFEHGVIYAEKDW
jgi:hypothetical protein